MSRVIFEEIECKSIINRVQAPGMGFRWPMQAIRVETPMPMGQLQLGL